MFLCIENVLEGGEEDCVVVVNEIELVALLVVERVPVGVVAENELVVVLEHLLES